MTPKLYSSSSSQPRKSSVDVDSDEDAEQRLGDTEEILPVRANGVVQVNAIHLQKNEQGSGSGGRGSRFESLLAAVGLEGKLKHLSELPEERKVTVYDIFCNRELKLSHIKAIGFDMDYTLVQYQQPAFDQLAFDGAKEKLVNQLGYPEQVLDFEYDHEVSGDKQSCAECAD